MKILNLYLTTQLILILALSLASANDSSLSLASTTIEKGGSQDAGGGNAKEAEFMRMARFFAKTIDSEGGISSLNLPAGGLSKFVNSVRVIADQNVHCDGGKKDACSSPTSKITKLDDVAFGKLSTFKKYQLVVHEILVLLETEDPNYNFSEELAARTYPYLINAAKSAEAKQDSIDKMREFLPAVQDFNKITTNFDGSITIENPRLRFEGTLRMIAASMTQILCSDSPCMKSHTNFKASKEGLCHIFGKRKVVFAQTKTLSSKLNRNDYRSTHSSAIVLNADSSFNKYVSTRGREFIDREPAIDVHILSKLTCK